MERIRTGRTGGDEMTPYNIESYKAKRADEFVQEVLATEPNEWGYIEVAGFGRVEYRDGKLLTDIPVTWRILNVERVKASGGWSRMDYRIEVSIAFGYGWQEAMESLKRKEECSHEILQRYRKRRELEQRKENLPEPEMTKAKRATPEVTSEVTSEISEDVWESSKRYALLQVLSSTDVKMTEQAYLNLKLFSGFEIAVAHKDGADWQRQQIINKAAEWLEENICEYLDGEDIEYSASMTYNITILQNERLVNEFKKAMEE